MSFTSETKRATSAESWNNDVCVFSAATFHNGPVPEVHRGDTAPLAVVSLSFTCAQA